MRRVTYKIDEVEYFRREYKRQNGGLTDAVLDELVDQMDPWRGTLVLMGDSMFHEYQHYYDENGNEQSIKDWNGFQHGVVYVDCMRHFAGEPLDGCREIPCCVIDIREDEVPEPAGTGLIGEPERIEANGQVWWTQMFCKWDGTLECINLYNPDGFLVGEYPSMEEVRAKINA